MSNRLECKVYWSKPYKVLHLSKIWRKRWKKIGCKDDYPLMSRKQRKSLKATKKAIEVIAGVNIKGGI